MTPVELLAKNYNYITWLRNRDEVSAGAADEAREKFLNQYLQLEKQAIMDAFNAGANWEMYGDNLTQDERAEAYYERFKLGEKY